MTNYYSKQGDFGNSTQTSGTTHYNPYAGGFTGSTIPQGDGRTQVTNMLDDIDEVSKVVKDEGLSHLYKATGDAVLGAEMPESTFTKAYDRSDSMLSSAKRIYEEVMRRVDGKFTKGIDNSLKTLNEVNGSENIYETTNLTYQKENVTYDEYGNAYYYKTTEHYTLSELLDNDTSPIQATQTIYDERLKNLRENIDKANDLTAEEIDKYQSMSDEELMDTFYPTVIGDYSGLKRAQWQEDNKEWLEPLEQYLGLALFAVAAVATVVSAGAASPALAATAAGIASTTGAIGTGYTVVTEGYSAATGNTLISGTEIDTDERFWSGVEALASAGTLGLGKALSLAGAADDTVAAANRTAGYVDDAADLGHTAYDATVHGEDPTLGLMTFAGGKALDGINTRAANNRAATSAPDTKVLDNQNIPNADLKNSDLPNNSVESKVDVTKGTPPIGDKTTKVNRPDDLPDIDTKLNNGHGPDGPEPALVGASPTKSPSADSAAADLPKPETHLDTSSQTSMPSGNRTRPSDVDLPNSKPDVSGSNSTNNTIPEANLNKGDVNPSRPTNSAGASSGRSGSDVPHVDTSKADPARPRTGDSGNPSSGSRGNDVSHVDTSKADLPNKAAADVASASSSAAAKSGSKPADIDVPESKPDVSGANKGADIPKADPKLLGSDGKFKNSDLESNYQKYVNKKTKAGQPPRDRLNWKEASDYWTKDSPMARGNRFNESVKSSDIYDYHELHLENGKFLDSYDPDAGEIISRKATDLDKISEKTYRGYLSEFSTKYSEGTRIRSNAYPELDGQTLKGKYILEIPASNQNIPDIERYKNIASEYNVELRFTEE